MAIVCDNQYMIRVGIIVGLLTIMFCSYPGFGDAKGMWSKVSGSSDGDVWYIDQTLAYENKHSKVMTSRAYLKCVPGRESELGEQIRESLDLSGIVPAGFSYLIGAVVIDCRTRVFHFSEITFFDVDDNALWRVDYDERQNYASIADHPSADISHYLCLDKSGFLDTLKKQEPFLYFFSK